MDNMKTNDKREIKSFLSEKKIAELKALLLTSETERVADTIILCDQKHTGQYSIKIPKKLAEAAQIDAKKDTFEFVLHISKDPLKKPTLKGELKRQGNE